MKNIFGLCIIAVCLTAPVHAQTPDRECNSTTDQWGHTKTVCKDVKPFVDPLTAFRADMQKRRQAAEAAQAKAAAEAEATRAKADAAAEAARSKAVAEAQIRAAEAQVRAAEAQAQAATAASAPAAHVTEKYDSPNENETVKLPPPALLAPAAGVPKKYDSGRPVEPGGSVAEAARQARIEKAVREAREKAERENPPPQQPCCS